MGLCQKNFDLRTDAPFRSLLGAAVQSSIHNHFNLERHLYRRSDFKENRSAALAEWRQLVA